jgi:hypothetical protein
MKITNQSLKAFFLASLMAFAPAVVVTAKKLHGPRGAFTSRTPVLRASPPRLLQSDDEAEAAPKNKGQSKRQTGPAKRECEMCK